MNGFFQLYVGGYTKLGRQVGRYIRSSEFSYGVLLILFAHVLVIVEIVGRM
jgi:hypothetical protein